MGGVVFWGPFLTILVIGRAGGVVIDANDDLEHDITMVDDVLVDDENMALTDDDIIWESNYMSMPHTSFSDPKLLPELFSTEEKKYDVPKTTSNLFNPSKGNNIQKTTFDMDESGDTTSNMITREDRRRPTRDRPFTVIVEGNVGSGKSTLLRIIQERKGIKVFQEPVKAWQMVGGQNLLSDMYSDPSRWSTTFQLFSTLTRLETGLAASEMKRNVVVLERSLYSERYCFVRMLADSGVINPGESALLDRYFKTITTHEGAYPEIDLIVYIHSNPEVLLNRINKRGRKEEASVKPEFLYTLHQMHEDWLVHKKFPVPAPVVILDGSQNFTQFKAEVNSWADTLPTLSPESWLAFNTWADVF